MTTTKPNRSSVFTVGLCNSFYESEKRIFLFDVDRIYTDYKTGISKPNPNFQDELKTIHKLYEKYCLDYCYHPTKQGIHFISPTEISREVWKKMMEEVKHINSKCPMTTLRFKPNKYEDENLIWYRAESSTFCGNRVRNNLDVCSLLNHNFETNFMYNPNLTNKVKTVSYPLPKSEFCK
jgi:hypothetical protein